MNGPISDEFGWLAYLGEVFGARKTTFTCECPQHAGSSGYHTNTGEELSNDDDAGLDSSVISFGLHMIRSTRSTYHGCGSPIRSHCIRIYTDEWIKCNSLEGFGNISWHTKHKRNQHSKAESTIQHCGDAHTQRYDVWCILYLFRCKGVNVLS